MDQQVPRSELIIRSRNPWAPLYSALAREHINQLLVRSAYSALEIRVPPSLPGKVSLARNLFRLGARIPKGSFLAFQYAHPIGPILQKFLRAMHHKGVRLILILHDLESLRSSSRNARQKEARLFQLFDACIAPNPVMSEYLHQDYGLSYPIISQDLFDYLVADPPMKPRQREPVLCYAGNFSKSPFIYRLGEIPGSSFLLYGPEPGKLSDNTDWQGLFNPDELPSRLEGSFGLVWDGEEPGSLSGPSGNYLRFNTPHKLSLYLAAGIPVIVPEESAVAGLVLKEGIGLTVQSLHELPGLIRDLGEDSYQDLVSKSRILGHKVRSGYFLTEALRDAESRLEQGFSPEI